MIFVPSKDYDSLLKQAYALHNLCDSQEKQLAYFRKTDYSLSEQRMSELTNQIESERAMNSRLTEELAKYD
jgi:hypothetical protein